MGIMKKLNFEITNDILLGINIPKGTKTLDIPKVCTIFNATCEHSNKITKVTLQDGINNIMNNAFFGYSDLKEINFPNSLRTIKGSFIDCLSLKNIKLNEGLETLINSFDNCGIENIYIPSSVKTIRYPFTCKSLKEITVSKDNPIYSDCDCNVIYNKHSNALIQGCSNSIIPKETKVIEERAFYRSCIKELNFPKNVKIICESAFTGSDIENIQLNDGLFLISKYAFSCCNNLKEITLPKSVNRIESSAFFSCPNLETVCFNFNIDASTHIDANIFEGCLKLKNIYVNNIDKDSEFYNKYKDKIKSMTLDMLINQGKSIKEINNTFKKIEKEK